MPQLTCHLDNPLSAGATGTGEGTVLLASPQLQPTPTKLIHSQKLKQTPGMGEYYQNEVREKKNLSLNVKPAKVSNLYETAGVVLHYLLEQADSARLPAV